METLAKAKLCLSIIKEHKAIEPILLDVQGLSSVTDFFLIASGHSSRQVQAVARHLMRKAREAGFRAFGIEGEQEGHWILMDYGDIVVHLFYEPLREFYDLESLWIEAPRLELEE
jgi:ribosome-associated protein